MEICKPSLCPVKVPARGARTCIARSAGTVRRNSMRYSSAVSCCAGGRKCFGSRFIRVLGGPANTILPPATSRAWCRWGSTVEGGSQSRRSADVPKRRHIFLMNSIRCTAPAPSKPAQRGVRRGRGASRGQRAFRELWIATRKYCVSCDVRIPPRHTTSTRTQLSKQSRHFTSPVFGDSISNTN